MSAKPKTIADVRDHLFTAMDQLADMTNEPNYERIRATCETAQVIINSVRVQVDYLRVVNGDGDMPFFDEPISQLPPNDKGGSGGASGEVLDPLEAGPSPDHPWRRRVHRIGR